MSTDGAGLLLASADVSSSDLGVYTVIGALMLVGVVLILIAAWLVRATKPEMELLAPLERMSDRSWRKLDPEVRRQELDSLRPDGARPVDRSSGVDPEPDTPEPGTRESGTPAVDDVDPNEAENAGPASSASESASTAPSVPAPSNDPGAGDDTAENSPPDLLDLDVEPIPSHADGPPALDTDDVDADDDADTGSRDPS